jgi:hypothetical protein
MVGGECSASLLEKLGRSLLEGGLRYISGDR